MPDTSKTPQESKMKTSKYWSAQMVLTYESVNEDGLNNREYISGAICFQNKDGQASPINFWYPGGGSQSCYLWEKVADALEIKPEELSPKQFVSFLGTKPKVEIIGKEYDNYTSDKNAPKTVTKNMPAKFVA